MRGREKNDFLKEKLERVRKALQQLKKDRRITGFLRTGPASFAKTKLEIDFYVAFISENKYLGRSLSIGKNIKISLFDTEVTVQNKILETIKRL